MCAKNVAGYRFNTFPVLTVWHDFVLSVIFILFIFRPFLHFNSVAYLEICDHSKTCSFDTCLFITLTHTHSLELYTEQRKCFGCNCSVSSVILIGLWGFV